jgi:tetratricopeptide (TPR) repeat protein
MVISLRARPLAEVIEFLNPLAEPQPRADLAMARTSTGATPLWLKDQRNRYWAEHLKEIRSLYLQINTMLDKDGETMEQFFDRVLAMADAEKVERMIIDIRQNNGGNHLALPLIHGLIRRPTLNQKGKLFVIIGRGTISAGQNLATLLEIHTNAVFVGEPTASRPNQYGSLGTFTLPNSKIFGWHSRLFIQDSDPSDYRPWLQPEIAASLSSQDYHLNRDPAMDAILSYQNLPPLSDTLEAAYASGGIAAVLDQYRSLAPRYKATGRNTERDLNRLGYRLVAKGKQPDAIAVFALNASEHPNSYNVHDSLGDAYLRSGNRAAGLKSYERSVELNPENEHAKRLIAAAALDR